MDSPLFTPLSIGGLELANRIVRSATYEGLATHDGRPGPRLAELYRALAEGGVGLIVTGGALIEPYASLPELEGLPYPLAIDHDRVIAAWRPVTDAVHTAGGRIALQIAHPGRLDPPMLRGAPPVAPSAVALEGGAVTPRALSTAEVRALVERFAQACRRAREAGFDAAQLHGAHGYLISNFLSPHTNLRDDDYGGSAERRARFAEEILRRARALVGPEFPLLVKLNLHDYAAGGLEPEEALAVASRLVRAGADALEVSGGTGAESPERIVVKGVRGEAQQAYFRELAAALKRRVDVPVVLVGGIRSLAVAERLIRDSVADLVALSRPLVREPALARRWRDGDRTDARCVSCNRCYERWMEEPLRCHAARGEELPAA